ncbi:MAG: ABC transporter permease [Chthoniobacterales bacterium]
MHHDIRYALRQLVKHPSFTLIAILALALGIGANTAIFSVVNAVLLRPLPYRAPQQLVWIWGSNPKNEIPHEVASYPDFNDWREQAQSFAGMAGFTTTTVTLGGTDGEPERVPAGSAIGDLFSVVGIEPVLGRKFLPEENAEGKNRVVLLSHSLWQRRFGGDARVIGQQITLNANQYTVVGVLPETFQDPLPGERDRLQLWLPLALTKAMKDSRRGDFLCTIARLKTGATLTGAQAEMSNIAARLEQQYQDTNTGWHVIVQPLHETITGDVRPALFVLLGAVSFLLLIACANVANLLLARASSRRREIAIRSALGASRIRIVRQLLTENVLLSLVGGACGLLFAFWGIDALLALSPGNIPRLDSIRIDREVLLFTLALSVMTGVIFGLAPALSVSKPQLNDTLKEGGRGSAESARGRQLRNGLAAAEIALSLVLLVGAGLLIRSFLHLQQVNPGFSPDHLLTAQLSLPGAKYAENQQVVNFYEQLLARVAHQPGVQNAAITTSLPLAGGSDYLAFIVEGHIPARTDRQPDAESRLVSAEYFRTLRIPLLKGRLFDDREGYDDPGVVVISDSLAQKYFQKEDPIGKRITFGDPEAKDTRWLTVIGIVGDVRGKTLSTEPYAQVYGSYRQSPRRALTVVARTAGDPLAMANTLRQDVSALDPQQPLYNVRTAEQVLAESIARPRFNTLLIAVLATVALLLAAVGIYGVIAYSVTQRTHEIGVRMALGATAADVVAMVVRQGMLVAGTGLAVGAVGALAATRTMRTLLYGISPADPVTYGGLALLLGAIALLASYIPARRATRVNPVIALRYE